MSHEPAHDRLRLVSPGEPSLRTDVPTTGTLVAVSPEGAPLVTLDADELGVQRIAQTTTDLTDRHVGRRVLVTFIDGDVDQPVITGLLSPHVRRGTAQRTEIAAEELFLRGDKELTLVCGKARITLTREGRVVVRGVDLLSRVSGTHRVRAGCIQLN